MCYKSTKLQSKIPNLSDIMLYQGTSGTVPLTSSDHMIHIHVQFG